MSEPHVLIAGASGLVGRAAVERFARGGVRTTAVSRRPPPDRYGATFISVDLADERACAEAFGGLTDVTQVVFAALHEEQDLVAGWLQDRHIQRNGAMLRNLVEPVSRASRALRNITILQGPKAYGVHVKPLRPGVREDRDEMYELPNFYWAQETYLREKQVGAAWNWTVIRPALVVGMAVGGAMNLLAAIGVYAALLKRDDAPLYYPGGPARLLEATDTDLMADCFDWVGRSESAANQMFNVTNGEAFTLRDQWPAIAESLGMEPGPDRPISFVETLPGRAGDWDAIRADHGLKAPAMDAFIGQSFQFADFVFARGADPAALGSSISTIKIRRAGFDETLYSEEMFRKWFGRYRAEKLLP